MTMIRLLTFSRFSLLREDRFGNEAMATAVASLSSQTTTFDCHVLQRPSHNCPLDSLGSHDQQTALQAAVSGQPVKVVVVTPGESVDCEFPDWMDVSVRLEAEPGVVVDWLSQPVGESDETALEWCHLDLSDDDDRVTWIAGALEAASAAVPEGADDTLIVTAVGGDIFDCGRFESLLWEGTIRVPLWISGCGSGRITQPTGSFDVLRTILASLNSASTAMFDDQSVDLRRFGGELSVVLPRSIRISQDGSDAIRTPDFFFVRSQSDELGEKLALYGKPHDVWNVHDLSHEYPGVVDELLARL
jgi:hypothetical protein